VPVDRLPAHVMPLGRERVIDLVHRPPVGEHVTQRVSLSFGQFGEQVTH
jgi:hypothetical protein